MGSRGLLIELVNSRLDSAMLNRVFGQKRERPDPELTLFHKLADAPRGLRLFGEILQLGGVSQPAALWATQGRFGELEDATGTSHAVEAGSYGPITSISDLPVSLHARCSPMNMM